MSVIPWICGYNHLIAKTPTPLQQPLKQLNINEKMWQIICNGAATSATEAHRCDRYVCWGGSIFVTGIINQPVHYPFVAAIADNFKYLDYNWWVNASAPIPQCVKTHERFRQDALMKTSRRIFKTSSEVSLKMKNILKKSCQVFEWLFFRKNTDN